MISIQKNKNSSETRKVFFITSVLKQFQTLFTIPLTVYLFIPFILCIWVQPSKWVFIQVVFNNFWVSTSRSGFAASAGWPSFMQVMLSSSTPSTASVTAHARKDFLMISGESSLQAFNVHSHTSFFVGALSFPPLVSVFSPLAIHSSYCCW